MDTQGITVGIDLGTCFSAIGYFTDSNNVELIPNIQGDRITPSIVAVSSDEILVGYDALIAKDNEQFIIIEKSKVELGSTKIYHTAQGSFKPEDIAVYILAHLKQYAEVFLKNKVEKAVVTVPAYFNAHQRKLVKTAAEEAGFTVLRILSEPTAASLNFNNIKDGEHVIVYDLGGGTFDCSILQMYQGLARVIATNGNTHLGGQNFDEAIAKVIIPNFDNLSAFSKTEALTMIEIAKKQLTSRDHAFINLNKIDKKLKPYTLFLNEFNKLTSDLLIKTKTCIFNCLKDAELEPSDIGRVLLVGGSTRLRAVKDLLQSIFSCPVETIGNPDESVALGATLHALDIAGEQHAHLLVDVIPLSVSVKLDNGFCEKIIRRNTPIPCDGEKLFTTAVDGQEKVLVEIYQGENELAQNNHALGTLMLGNIKTGLKGEPRILVTFNIDHNAVLSIVAKDLDTKSEAEAIFDYDFNTENESVDETYFIAIKNHKLKLQELKLINQDAEQLQLINDALSSDNLEFIQSVVDTLT